MGFNIEIPEELHKQFKISCIEREVFMEDQIIDLVRRDVERWQKKNV